MDQARDALVAFQKVLPVNSVNSGFDSDSEQQILQIAREWRGKWLPDDRQLFSTLSSQLSEDNGTMLMTVLETPWWHVAFARFWKVIAVQVLFWILLLYFYPKSTGVQAFFFWNRWARKFFGLGYVDLCLTWIPFLRSRLLSPFKEELLADAQVGDKSLNDYFEDIQVQEGEKTLRLGDAIPVVDGQIVLEGESGLGKSTFLRRLAKNAPHPLAYLPAENCDRGVFELIQLKLKGKASDEQFLKSVIWSGGLRVIVDGLNEVTVETREKIRRFVDDFPKAHVLLATQPMLWKRPPKARILRLLKLDDARILSFLTSRYPTVAGPGALSETDYGKKCRDYIEDVLGPSQSEEDRIGSRLVLSNPMDLGAAAGILVVAERPTLRNLQEQQFQRVNREFRDLHPGQTFPLVSFSESVYQKLHLNDVTLDANQFFEAIQVLLKHRMALVQHDRDSSGKETEKWIFRHDKIRDYFLVIAFNAQPDQRLRQHIDDPRFRGVYLMLSAQLRLDQAKQLRDALVDRAAETKDHYLSDAVVEILKTRKLSTTQFA